jgi:hypothetical protein
MSKPISPLRQRMIDDMTFRNMSLSTHKVYTYERAHRPDPAQRKQVETLAAYGIPECDISRVVGIDPKTLRKHYRDELDTGETKANAQVAGFLFNSRATATSPHRSSGSRPGRDGVKYRWSSSTLVRFSSAPPLLLRS